MGISGNNAKVVTETEAFWGDKAIDGATGQPSEAKGTRDEVAGGVSLAVLGASPLESQVSERNGAIAGAATELLRG